MDFRTAISEPAVGGVFGTVGHPGLSELKFFFLALLFYLGDVHLKQQRVSEDGQLEPPGFEMRSVS